MVRQMRGGIEELNPMQQQLAIRVTKTQIRKIETQIKKLRKYGHHYAADTLQVSLACQKNHLAKLEAEQ